MRSCVRVNRHIQRDYPCQIIIDVIEYVVCEHKIFLIYNYCRNKIFVLVVCVAKRRKC